jgi:hypothetical protein
MPIVIEEENMAMPAKTIDTLVSDVYELVHFGKEASEENLALLAEGIKTSIAQALREGCQPRPPTLRMSAIGTPDRKLWYSLKGFEPESKLSPSQAISFMYGHLIEQFILFLAREAGHKVTEEQREVELDGVVGHIDCRLDGLLVDVKGMSGFGFNKFLTGDVLKEDSFGYIPQISGYAQAMGDEAAAFFVMSKESGLLTLFIVDEFHLIDARRRITHVREMLKSDVAPERCFKLVPDGKSGNLMLDKQCTWCPFKQRCYADANDGQGLREFKYYGGTKYLAHVAKEPRVEEITKEAA